jgi:hypothetical protein
MCNGVKENLFHYFSFEKNVFHLREKYDFLKKMQENVFLTEEAKVEILELFSQIQKIYFSLSKFASYYRWKRSNLVITTDLGLNPITLNQKNVLCVFHQGQ